MHIFKRSKSQSRDESIKCENKNTHYVINGKLNPAKKTLVVNLKIYQ